MSFDRTGSLCFDLLSVRPCACLSHIYFEVFGEEVAMERRCDFLCGRLWVVRLGLLFKSSDRAVVCDGATNTGWWK